MSKYLFNMSYSGVVARANFLAKWNKIFASIAFVSTLLFIVFFFIFLVAVF